MRLNFWQWIGLALLVVGLLLYVFKHSTPTANPPSAVEPPPPPVNTGNPATQPAAGG